MRFLDFVERVMAHPDLEIVGTLNERGEPVGHEGLGREDVYLAIDNTRLGIGCRVDLRRLHEDRWEDLLRVLEGGEEKAIHSVTRIVGYFSHVENWNPSKKAELRDRHRGNYAVV